MKYAIVFILFFMFIPLQNFSKSIDRKLLNDNVKINQLQVIGSHNSYKLAIDSCLMNILKQEDSSSVLGLDYYHIPLKDQLKMGLRNLEIDICYDPDGGRYAKPYGMQIMEMNGCKYAPYDTSGLMNTPGFKVLHIPDIDFRTSCLTLQECLKELKVWSDDNPEHLPIIITMNAKEDGIDRPGFTKALKFDKQAFDDLDKEILNGISRKKLIIPDDVRGKFNTLEEAVLNGNWPTLKNARGKFIFILDESGEKLKMYIEAHPSLKGRILFTDSHENTPEAAIRIINEPDEKFDYIQKLVKTGYIVRTRADAGTIEARQGDYSRFKFAKESGAQIITTDYYLPNPKFKTGYKIFFDSGLMYRKNPILDLVDFNDIDLE